MGIPRPLGFAGHDYRADDFEWYFDASIATCDFVTSPEIRSLG